MHDKQVDHRAATQAFDQFMVVEGPADVVARPAQVGPFAVQHPLAPRGRPHGLAALDRIGLGHVGVQALQIAHLQVNLEDGEQLVADDPRQGAFDGIEQHRRLSRVGRRPGHFAEGRPGVGAGLSRHGAIVSESG